MVRKPPYAIKGMYGGVRGGESPLLDYMPKLDIDSRKIDTKMPPRVQMIRIIRHLRGGRGGTRARRMTGNDFESHVFFSANSPDQSCSNS